MSQLKKGHAPGPTPLTQSPHPPQGWALDTGCAILGTTKGNDQTGSRHGLWGKKQRLSDRVGVGREPLGSGLAEAEGWSSILSGNTPQPGRALLSSSCLVVLIPSPISFVVNKMGLLIALTPGSGEI